MGLCSTQGTRSHAAPETSDRSSIQPVSHLRWPRVQQVPSSTTRTVALPAPCTRPPPLRHFSAKQTVGCFNISNLKHIRSLFPRPPMQLRPAMSLPCSRQEAQLRKHLGSVSPPSFCTCGTLCLELPSTPHSLGCQKWGSHTCTLHWPEHRALGRTERGDKTSR